MNEAPADPTTQRGRRVALGVLLALAFLAVAYLVAPLWVGLVVGTVMAFTAHPAYRWLASRLRDKRPLAALITTVVGGILMASGASAAFYLLAREMLAIVGAIQARTRGQSLSDLVGDGVARLVDTFRIPRDYVMAKLNDLLSQASAFAAQAARVLLETTTSAVVTLVVALFTMYYVLLEWPRIALRLERLLPLEPRHTRALVVEAREVARAAFVGTLGTAVIQGILAGIGFTIAGAPQPILWGGITIFASFIPVVGSVLVWAGVAVYLLLTGHVGGAIFDIAWGAIMVGVVSDYVIRPRLAGRAGQGNPLLMLIALIGGIRVFGLAGLVVGPVIMSLFVAIAHIYEREAEAESRKLRAT
jgi:predicted PurR-regulated permease PerM